MTYYEEDIIDGFQFYYPDDPDTVYTFRENDGQPIVEWDAVGGVSHVTWTRYKTAAHLNNGEAIAYGDFMIKGFKRLEF
jgi:hypothetical protein